MQCLIQHGGGRCFVPLIEQLHQRAVKRPVISPRVKRGAGAEAEGYAPSTSRSCPSLTPRGSLIRDQPCVESIADIWISTIYRTNRPCVYVEGVS